MEIKFEFDKQFSEIQKQINGALKGMESDFIKAVGPDLPKEDMDRMIAMMKVGNAEGVKAIIDKNGGKLDVKGIQEAAKALRNSGLSQKTAEIQKEILDLKRKLDVS